MWLSGIVFPWLQVFLSQGMNHKWFYISPVTSVFLWAPVSRTCKWICIFLISVAFMVSIFFCWPAHYTYQLINILTWILTTIWIYLSQVCKCSSLVFHCRHLPSLGFQVSCFPCDLQLMTSCRKFKRVQDCPTLLVGLAVRMQAMLLLASCSLRRNHK